jgi:glycosyltransferase involved in cell wall biosynthesis
MRSNTPKENVIVHLSTYPPRECGIATFTQDLTTALNTRFNPITYSRVVALNEHDTSLYNYPPQVHDQVTASHLPNYVALAEKLNQEPNIKLVNIQHEFGIFGGDWGDYLIPFLQVIKKPVVTTFHSVLPKPEEHVKKLVRFIAEKSRAVIVMNQRSQNLLEKTYDVDPAKIFLVPHGIPNTTFDDGKEEKTRLRLEGKIVLSTFGLLGRDKGNEYVIRALPKVVKKYPNLVYLILGETHPVLRKQEGEKYRNFLMAEVSRLGLKNHVKFYPKYMTIEEIVQYLKASDIYLASNAEPRQSVSGTLSYALGCGRPVIATATEYAKYAVTRDVGILVRCRSQSDITKALLKLLANEKMRQNMGRMAYEHTRHMIWPNVAGSYFDVYKQFVDLEEEERKLPPIKLDHLVKMTDSFGLIQHAKYDKPNLRFGYSLDDNARALLFCARNYLLNPDDKLRQLMQVYLKFINYCQRPKGDFCNIVDIAKKRDTTHEGDVLGRTIWALGFVAAAEGLPNNISKPAERMLRKALPAVTALHAPRAAAFSLLGLYPFLKRYPNQKLMRLFTRFADLLVKLYHNRTSADWQWFEDDLTYSNSKLSECLFFAYDLTKKQKYLRVGIATLKFLTSITFENRQYSPIGQNGWYARSGIRSYFDQQPEDAASMVQTKVAAYKITGEKRQLREALLAFQWFLGKNYLNQMVYNEATGGCHDGVGQHTLNLNQGAESTICYLLARLEFEDPGIIKALQKI